MLARVVRILKISWLLTVVNDEDTTLEEELDGMNELVRDETTVPDEELGTSLDDVRVDEAWVVVKLQERCGVSDCS
jgi:hypothetical protein